MTLCVDFQSKKNEYIETTPLPTSDNTDSGSHTNICSNENNSRTFADEKTVTTTTVPSSVDSLDYLQIDLPSSPNIPHKRKISVPRKKQSFQVYECEFCDAEFVHQTHLRVHLRSHTGEKPYVCHFCGRGFAQKGNLRVHEKIHTGEKDFVCILCQKAFITNAQLLVHTRTHSNPNKKRPHVTGRPYKHVARYEIRKETNDDDTSVAESMKKILGQLATPTDKQASSAESSGRFKAAAPSNAHISHTILVPTTYNLNNSHVSQTAGRELQTRSLSYEKHCKNSNSSLYPLENL